MKRTTVNLVIDLLGALLFVGMIGSGYILYFALPPGTNKSMSLWNLTRHQWGHVHFWISVGLLAVLLAHLALHWQWVVTTVARRLGLTTGPRGPHVRSAVITLVAVVAVMGLFAWVAEVSVRERDVADRSREGTGGRAEAGTEDSGIPPAGSRSRVDFQKDVYPILESACHRCHGLDTARAGFRVDRREDYFGTGGKAAFVIPGNSAESPLIDIVSGRRPDMAMAARHKLPERDVAVLRAWIDAGAEWPKRLQQE